MNIVIAGHFEFPGSPASTLGGSATASRIRHMAVGLTKLGHKVHVISMSPKKPDYNGPATNIWHDYQGISHYVTGAFVSSKAIRSRSVIKIRKEYFKAYRRGLYESIRCIDVFNQKHRVDVVIGYSFLYLGMHGLIKYCKKKGILAVRDVVEWYDPDFFPGGRLNPQYWDAELNIRFSLPKSDGIIAISKFLADKFSSQGVKVIRIPAIIDPDNFIKNLPRQTTRSNDVFQLTYLGAMAALRDGPMLMMQAVREVLMSGSKVFFNIVGTDGNFGHAIKAKEYANRDPILKNHVKFWGRVSDREVIERLFNSDALVFTRLASRSGNAAFPTRLPEYLMSGRPVISSDVSDIAEYLTDGKEAIIVKPNSVEALVEGITKLIKLPDHGKTIGQAGKKRCYECFNYRTRCEEISNFLQDLISASK